jgi:nucleotide-binding universal stress UspA family protein
MFTRILVPLDRSSLAECVLPHAIALARALESKLILLHVMTVSDGSDRLRAVDPLEWHLRRAEAESYLQAVCARLQEAGVPCEAHVNDGDAAELIVDFAHENEIDLVLMASHGQSGLSGWNVSSVVQKVIMRTRASIMIVRAYETPQTSTVTLQYQRILAPLDNSQRAECVLPLVGALARIPETRILLAHVVERPAMPRRTPLSREDMELADRVMERNRSEAENYLAFVRLQLPPSAIEIRLLVDMRVASALHELVNQERVDLVLLSAHGYSGDMRWPHGGLVAHFVAYGSCPLLIFQDAPGGKTLLTRAEAAERNYESR